MDLWIRSQDREILGCFKDIAIIEGSLVETANGNKFMYEIVGYFDKETQYETLGKYIGKVRALEVLDEIQDYIVNLELKEYINKLGVYEMPEE